MFAVEKRSGALCMDLLFHLPSRYQDRTRLRPLGELRVGDEALVEGVITDAQIAHGRRRSLKVWITDATRRRADAALLPLLPGAVRGHAPGVSGCAASARCAKGRNRWRWCIRRCNSSNTTDASRSRWARPLTPIYPSTEGMQQISWRGLMDQALALLMHPPTALRDWVPAEIAEPLRLPSLAEALVYLHRPPPDAPVQALLERTHPVFLRLAFEEMLAHQLALRRLRAHRRDLPAPVLAGDGRLRGACWRACRFGSPARSSGCATRSPPI
jgi:ATP-dependent DNA helicase RecG